VIALSPRGLGCIGERDDFKAGARSHLDAAEILGEDPVAREATARELIRGVLNQGGLGSCVINALEQAIRGDVRRQTGKWAELCARLFGYMSARLKHGDENNDSGTYIETGVEQRAVLGAPPEHLWPYRPDERVMRGGVLVPRWRARPSQEAFQAAIDTKTSRALAYRRIYGVDDERAEQVKRAIMRKRLVVFRTDVSEQFCMNDFDPKRPNPTPRAGDPSAGGHALVAAEYDDVGVKGPNSWDYDFGDKGWFYFTWEHIGGPLCGSFTIIEQAPVPPGL